MESLHIQWQGDDYVVLTTVRLLLIGWKMQHSICAESGSGICRMQRPSWVFHMHILASKEVDTIISLDKDQAKSLTAPVCPRRVCSTVGGVGTSWHTDIVPSREQQARRCLSSFANCTLGTRKARGSN